MALHRQAINDLTIQNDYDFGKAISKWTVMIIKNIWQDNYKQFTERE